MSLTTAYKNEPKPPKIFGMQGYVSKVKLDNSLFCLVKVKIVLASSQRSL